MVHHFGNVATVSNAYVRNPKKEAAMRIPAVRTFEIVGKHSQHKGACVLAGLDEFLMHLKRMHCKI
jgi:hypothetical protein